jgi:hypothetical protein
MARINILMATISKIIRKILLSSRVGALLDRLAPSLEKIILVGATHRMAGRYR